LALEEAKKLGTSINLACEWLLIDTALVSKARWIEVHPEIIGAVESRAITAEMVALLGRLPDSERLTHFQKLVAKDEPWTAKDLKAELDDRRKAKKGKRGGAQ
jgi:hypothetical protein